MKTKNGNKGRKNRQEKLSGSVYTARPYMGKSDEVRMRHLLANDYGKKSAPERPVNSGLPGFPSRTMIRS